MILQTTGAWGIATVTILSILTFATVAILILRRISPANLTYRKVVVIVRSWWLIAGAFLLALAWPRWGVIVLMCPLTLLSLREYLRISKVPYRGYFLFALSLLTLLQYFLISIGSLDLFFSALPVLCLWIIPGLVIYRATVPDLELVTSVGIGLTLLVYYTSYLPAVASFPQLGLTPDETTYAVLSLLLLTWSNDVFQFLAGKGFGRRKIVPEISPNKTLAGFIGGILGSVVLSSVVGTQLLHLSLGASVGLGLLIGMTGMFGDLFFSAVKRKIGVKDFSQVLAGHGGLLDRLDSLVFTAPIFFHYLLRMRG